MNRHDVKAVLDRLAFDRGQYCLITGAALVLHGVRAETADIDMNVVPDLFRILAERHPTAPAGLGGNKIVLMDGVVEVFPEDLDQQRIEYVEGYPVESLAAIRSWKVKMGRPKDAEDVRLIDSHLRSARGAEEKR